MLWCDIMLGIARDTNPDGKEIWAHMKNLQKLEDKVVSTRREIGPCQKWSTRSGRPLLADTISIISWSSIGFCQKRSTRSGRLLLTIEEKFVSARSSQPDLAETFSFVAWREIGLCQKRSTVDLIQSTASGREQIFLIFHPFFCFLFLFVFLLYV